MLRGMEYPFDLFMLVGSINQMTRSWVLRNGVKKQELDTDIQREYNRQRDYLEKSVDNLKRKCLPLHCYGAFECNHLRDQLTKHNEIIWNIMKLYETEVIYVLHCSTKLCVGG